MKIDLNESFYSSTVNYPELRDALIEFGFKPMKNDLTYNTVGKSIKLKQAIQHISKTEKELVLFLNEKGIEVDIYES
ncbi:MAG: hypothetical protein RR565_05530 [Erysipelothrix sp.]